MSDMNINDQEALAALVEGKTDDEINAFLKEAGVDQVLDQIFGAMKDRFQADKAAGQTAVVGWDISTPDGTETYQFKVDNGTCEVIKGGTEPAKVTLGLSLPDFIRFIAGKLDGMQAFMSGRLKLSGDMMFAQTMQAWFAA
jgi:putative sterol carrier protein